MPEDEWSDIHLPLPLRLGEDVDATSLADDWSECLRQRFGVVE